MKQSTNTYKYIIFDDDAIYSNQNRLLQIKISLYLMTVLCPIWKKLRSVTCFARYLFIVLHSLYTKWRNDQWLCNNSMLFVYKIRIWSYFYMSSEICYRSFENNLKKEKYHYHCPMTRLSEIHIHRWNEHSKLIPLIF
jgi:hypothetical protein